MSFSITYGTGSVSGTTAQDTIHIAGISTPLTFGLATNVSQEFNAYPMDGILGLGRGTASSLDDSPQLIDTLAAANLIPAKLYGIHLSRAADGTHDGELNLGEVNTARFDGDLNWLDAIPNDTGFWELRIADAGTGSALTGLKGKSAIIDTGTSYVFMPEPDAIAVHALVDGSTQSGETFSVPCSTTTDLAIKFGQTTYAVSAKDWVGGTTTGGMCRSNVFGRQTFGDDQWLLGDVFLKNVYAAFDLDKGKVGFGTKRAGDASSSSTSESESKTATAENAASTASASASEAGAATTTTPVAAPILPPGASPSTTSTPTSNPASSSASAKDQNGASSRAFPASLLTLTLVCIASPALLVYFV